MSEQWATIDKLVQLERQRVTESQTVGHTSNVDFLVELVQEIGEVARALDAPDRHELIRSLVKTMTLVGLRLETLLTDEGSKPPDSLAINEVVIYRGSLLKHRGKEFRVVQIPFDMEGTGYRLMGEDGEVLWNQHRASFIKVEDRDGRRRADISRSIDAASGLSGGTDTHPVSRRPSGRAGR